MSQSRGSRGTGAAADADAELAQQVGELNLRVLQFIREIALHAGDGPAPLPAAITALRGAWQSLPDPALAAVAKLPYVLLEGAFDGFSDERPRIAAVRDSSLVPSGARGGGVAEAVGLFNEPAGRAIALSLFHYAWHLARGSRLTAALVLGTTSASIEPLRDQSLQALEADALRCAPRVRLRWDARPDVWSRLLTAAVLGDEPALQNERLRGLQRIAGACRTQGAG